jgi:hypothetical protein
MILFHSSESWWKIVGNFLRVRTKTVGKYSCTSKFSEFIVGTRRINSICMSKKCSVPLILEYCVIRSGWRSFPSTLFTVNTLSRIYTDLNSLLFCKSYLFLAVFFSIVTGGIVLLLRRKNVTFLFFSQKFSLCSKQQHVIVVTFSQFEYGNMLLTSGRHGILLL